MSVEVCCSECVNGNRCSEYRHKGCRGDRQPSRGEWAIGDKSRHEAAGIHHEHAKPDQHCGQSNTEGEDQKESQSDSVQGEGAEQNHEGGWAWNDAARDSKCKELRECDGLTWVLAG